MDLERHLHSATVLDCQGRTRYELTLLIDGTVRVRFLSGTEAIVNLEDRRCLTPGVSIPDDLWPELAAMRPA